MQKIDMSVIVTVYNIENYIADCIESILKEDRISIELILVDDTSYDRSYNICMDYASRDERVKVIRNEVNRGITSSRNVGLKISTGEYIYIMDGDDVLKDDALYKMYRLCKKENLDLLEFSAEVFYDDVDGRKFAGENDYKRTKLCNQILNGTDLFIKLFDAGETVRWSAYLHCYKGTLLREKELYYVEGLRYADGSEFHLYMAAERAMCIADIFYRRRVRENSQITSKVKIHYLESLIVLFVEEMRLWNGYGFSNEINCGIEKYFRLRHREILDMYQQLREYKGATPILDKWPSAKYFYNHIVKQIPVCIDKFSKEEEKKMYQAKAIYVYGAGFMATEVAKVLDYKGFDYKCVVTNKNSSKDSFNGREILSIDEVNFEDGDLVIVSLSQIHHKAIVEILLNKKCDNYLLFSI